MVFTLCKSSKAMLLAPGKLIDLCIIATSFWLHGNKGDVRLVRDKRCEDHFVSVVFGGLL